MDKPKVIKAAEQRITRFTIHFIPFTIEIRSVQGDRFMATIPECTLSELADTEAFAVQKLLYRYLGALASMAERNNLEIGYADEDEKA